MYLGNLVGLIVVLATVPLFRVHPRIPFSVSSPVIIVIFAGTYLHRARRDAEQWFMLAFSVIGYGFEKLDYPPGAAGAGPGAGGQGRTYASHAGVAR